MWNAIKSWFTGERTQLRDALYSRTRQLREYGDYLDFLQGQVDRLNNDLAQFALYPLSTLADRQYGANWPMFRTEQELALFRQQTRILVAKNNYARGFLNGIRAYTIGEGHTYRAITRPEYATKGKPSGAASAYEQLRLRFQGWIDAWLRVNHWTPDADGNDTHQIWREIEKFNRKIRDGECALRYFRKRDGLPRTRFVSPEQITKPAHWPLQSGAFGILTDEEDAETIRAFHIRYRSMPAAEGDVVPADEMYFIKRNVDAEIKRGLSDFTFDVAQCLVDAGKLRRNISSGASVQAAIAWIEQYELAPQEDITALRTANTEYTQTNLATGQTSNFERYNQGTILRIPKGKEYKSPPFYSGSQSYLDAVQMDLRGAGVIWNAPEALLTGTFDAATFATALAAESPFILTCKLENKMDRTENKAIVLRAARMAIEDGDLPRETLQYCDLLVAGKVPEARNKVADAQVDQIYVGMGVDSRQNVAHKLGNDWEQVETDNTDFANEHGPAATQLELPGFDEPPTHGAEHPFESREQKEKVNQ